MIPIKYNLRNLVVRKTTTIASGLGLALVVFVLASVLMLSESIRRTLGRSADEDVAVVLRRGADAELSSSFADSQVGILLASPGLMKSEDGRPLAVAELVVVASIDKLGVSGASNVQIRGVPDNVMKLRKDVKIIDGRAAQPGTDEVVIGTALRGRFKGIDLNQSFDLRKNRTVKVVGVFADNGSSFESEVWADVKTLGSAFGRDGFVSSARVKLESPAKFDSFKAAAEGNPQLEVQVLRETDYYEKQSEGTSLFITAIGVVIAVFFSVGAIIGATITMHASVAYRQREIATLRALGFSKANILVSFLFESVILAVGGGVVGVLASLGMSFVKFSTMNFASYSEISFTFEPTPTIMATALAVAAAMGIFGGFFPALRAARMDLVTAIRGG